MLGRDPDTMTDADRVQIIRERIVAERAKAKQLHDRIRDPFLRSHLRLVMRTCDDLDTWLFKHEVSMNAIWPDLIEFILRIAVHEREFVDRFILEHGSRARWE